MSRTRAKGAGKDRAEPETIFEFFFENGDPRYPRQELVTRADLWNALAWYDDRVRSPRVWWRRLWRAMTRKAAWNPFGWVRLERLRREREGG